MLGTDFQVMIPNLTEIRSLEEAMDEFKQERKNFLEKHEIGQMILTKIEKRESSNFVDKRQPKNNLESSSLSKELNLSQVVADKKNATGIWDKLGMDAILEQSESPANLTKVNETKRNFIINGKLEAVLIQFQRQSLEDYLDQLCDLQLIDLVLESFNFRLKILDAFSNKVFLIKANQVDLFQPRWLRNCIRTWKENSLRV